MKNYVVVSFRVYDKNYKKIMACKLFIEEKDLKNVLDYIDGSDNRIVIYDSINVYRGKEFIKEMIKKVEKDVEELELF